MSHRLKKVGRQIGENLSIITTDMSITDFRRVANHKRAFAVAAPAAWNSLPADVRSAPTLDKFKQCLKTHLFIQSYYS